MTLIEKVDFDLAMSPVLLLSIDMVDSMLKSCPSRISDSIGCDVSNAIDRCNQTRRVKTNLLDNGIGRYLGINRSAICAGRNALGPTNRLEHASKLENKSNEIDREAAGTSERCGEILLAIGPYLRISRWSGRMRRRGSSLMPRYRYHRPIDSPPRLRHDRACSAFAIRTAQGRAPRR